MRKPLLRGVFLVAAVFSAEVLAAELGLDLYRIDLAGVVSKYVGETEKNLRRVFDAAERSGAIEKLVTVRDRRFASSLRTSLRRPFRLR